jgi:hypothetical protein
VLPYTTNFYLAAAPQNACRCIAIKKKKKEDKEYQVI